MSPRVLLLLFLSFLPVAARASCNLHLRYENGELRWDAVPGAQQYWVQESFDGMKTSRNFSTRENVVKVTHRASAPTVVRYAVTAEIETGVRALADGDSTDACVSAINVTLGVDAAFRDLTRRAVLPIVGSTPGAFGGRFRTALVMRGSPDQHGRLIFHPAGGVASDSDPSMRYSFSGPEPLAFDDVVAAMGQSGIGSMDVVPDADSLTRLPEMQVRLYNDTSIGTFGTFVTPVLPYDYLGSRGLEIRIPDARFRVNVGLRALTGVTVKVLVFGADGRLRDLRDRDFPAGWMQLTSASDFAGSTLAPGESLTLLFTGGAVPFYTITENATNDPTLVVPPARGSSSDVGAYVD
ncbi:MAG TPA: hypothetical protein VF824_00445 [Thermoanaerobaculia bacterium]